MYAPFPSLFPACLLQVSPRSLVTRPVMLCVYPVPVFLFISCSTHSTLPTRSSSSIMAQHSPVPSSEGRPSVFWAWAWELSLDPPLCCDLLSLGLGRSMVTGLLGLVVMLGTVTVLWPGWMPIFPVSGDYTGPVQWPFQACLFPFLWQCHGWGAPWQPWLPTPEL